MPMTSRDTYMSDHANSLCWTLPCRESVSGIQGQLQEHLMLRAQMALGTNKGKIRLSVIVWNNSAWNMTVNQESYDDLKIRNNNYM